jgi:hypothetical protein
MLDQQIRYHLRRLGVDPMTALTMVQVDVRS